MPPHIPNHPGRVVRDQIIPKGVTVKAAADLMGVGRPALSNFLNGKAALSPGMAAKLEQTFGANAGDLLALQSAYDTAQTHSAGAAKSARSFVPPFLRAKANDIEGWADQLTARSRLSVFLRILVHSTGRDLSRVDFPGNDDSERPGWDGYVESAAPSPWIPDRASGWEFGTNKDMAAKATSDYAKSVKAIPKAERLKITFVFLTPRRWLGKKNWQQERRLEREWRDVLVYDSSDLEQWLEQSIPAQTWFAGEQGKKIRGTSSLDRCWVSWNADCDPPFTCHVFDEAKATVGKRMLDRIKKDPEHRFKIAADSREEAFAFLSCLFSADDEFTAGLRDRAIVFEEVGPLSELASSSSSFIPIIADKAVEKELSQLGVKMGAVLIYPRSVIRSDAEFVLDTLSYSAFATALETMHLSRDRIEKLNHESGRSLTVLRRRLSKSVAIQHPDWSENSRLAAVLAPALLAGAWNVSSDMDRFVLQYLASVASYEEFEADFAELLALEHTPVWSIGNFRGVVSKIDALYSIPLALNQFVLDRFYDVAGFVLSEDDPALDLPEKDRWAAGMYGKTRDISAALREGISETLVLLAIHAKPLLGVDGQLRADLLIRTLLGQADSRALESQARDLPLYAEASPDEFLRVLESDLRQPEPRVLALMRPAGDPMFSTTPRVGLLWALESLAWSPEYVSRAVEILATLAELHVDDNISNKPDQTLQSIFRSWMPQTGAPLEQRISLLERLVRQHPTVAWPICVAQFDHYHSIGNYNNKPRWRDFAFGFGEPTNAERAPFVIRAIELALDWPVHTKETLDELIENREGLRSEDRTKIWNLVDKWAAAASEEDRAWLREKIRVLTMTRRAKVRTSPDDDARRASASYRMLEPRDPIRKHAWLFREHHVEESIADAETEIDLRKSAERIERQRKAALKAVYQQSGPGGLLSIALGGNAGYIVGALGGTLLTSISERKQFVELAMSREALAEAPALRALLAGLFSSMSAEDAFALLDAMKDDVSFDDMVRLATLMAFKKRTWEGTAALGSAYEDRYWELVHSDWANDQSDIDYAVRRLLAAGRPRAAFALTRYTPKRLDPSLLFAVLESLPGSAEEGFIGNLEAHYLRDALAALDKSKAFTVEQMAGLEFVYLELFKYGRGGIPNIERQIEDNPALFVEAIRYLYKRRDGTSEGDEADDVKAAAAEKAYHLLEILSNIPGRDEDGQLTAERLGAWVADVRRRCAAADRAVVGDIVLGGLLSKAPADADGVWPCMPVRDVLEEVLTEEMGRGLRTGIYNSRGVHGRGEGGQQERDLAEKYEAWARAMDYTHPRVAAVLRALGGTYRQEADWQDNEAGIRKRLHY